MTDKFDCDCCCDWIATATATATATARINSREKCECNAIQLGTVQDVRDGTIHVPGKPLLHIALRRNIDKHFEVYLSKKL